MMKKDVLKKCILIFVAVVIVIAICFLVANRLRNNDQTHSGGNEQEEWLATVNGNIELSEKETLGESITVTVSLDTDENIDSVALYALQGGISEIEATKIDDGVYEAEINFEELNAEDGYYQFEAVIRDNNGNEKEIISEDTVNYFKTGVSYAHAYQKEDGRTAVQITAFDKGEVLVSTTNETPTADDTRWTKYEAGEEYIIATPEENVENVYVWYKNGENIINAADSGISVMSFADGQTVTIQEAPKPPFVMEWTIPAGADGTDENGKLQTIIKLPTYTNNGFSNYTVDWGDGKTNTYTREELPEHIYNNTSEEVYEIKITGKLYGFGYVSGKMGNSDRYRPTKTNEYSDYYTFTQYLTSIKSWGELEIVKYRFAFCKNLETIASPEEETFKNVTDFSFCFSYCTKLKSIPADLFDSAVSATNFSYAFYSSGLSGPIPANLFASNTSARDFSNIFRDCSDLSGEIPAELFAKNTSATTFASTFSGCSGLSGAIPTNLFANNTSAREFLNIFRDCSGLSGEIPAELFAKNTNATTFSYAFSGCSGLSGEIPAELFAKNTSATTFASTFSGCSGLTGAIPAELFANNADATTFQQTFANCSGLSGAIPTNLFANNTIASNFSRTFYNCSGLTSSFININTETVTSNYGMFAGCTNIKYLLLGNNFGKIQSTKSNSSYVFAEAGTYIITLREEPIEFLKYSSYDQYCPATLYVKNSTSNLTIKQKFEQADTEGMFGAERIKEVIELIGDSTITISTKEGYTELGANVAGHSPEDLKDCPQLGLTFEIDTTAVDNALANKTPGEYDVTYILKNYGEIVSTKTRKVTITAPQNYKNNSNQYFTTLAEAFNGTATGGTITVIGENVQESTRATLTDNKSIILDLNGKTITYTSEFIGVIDATLEVKDSKDNGEINNATNYFSALYYHSNGNIIISGGTIKGLRGISRSDYGAVGASVTMTGGQINATSICIDVTTEDTVVVTGGKLISSTDVGINYAQDESGRLVGSLTIGTKGGAPNTQTPMLQGETYAINSVSGFEFYDGILKGKAGAFNGNVTDIEPGYGIHYDTEGEYQTATLVDANYQDNKGNYYATLADAFAKAPSGSTITVLRDVTDNSQGILTSGKTLTLELNGKTINAQGSESIINNQGKLTIQDSIGGGNISRNINALSNYMISNSSEMIITGGKFAINKEYVAVCISSSNILKIENAEIETSIINTRNTGDNLTAGIVANGETIINNTKITSRAPSSIYTCGGILCNAGAVSTITLNNVNIDSDIRGIILVNHAGTGGKNGSSLTVQGSSSITGKKYGIYNEYAVGGITIDGGTISGGSAGIYQNANNTITLNNGIITGGRGVQIDNGTFDMKGGKVEASVNAVETTHGKLIIRNGEVVGGPTATSLVNFGNGYIEVIGGTVSGGYAGIFSSKESAGEVRIKGGSIIDRSYIASDPASGSGIYNAGSTNIYVEGEEISAALRGIYNLGTGTVTIGTSGGGVNTAVPSIQGGTYGIDSTNGFEFYDGILKGKAGAFNGNVTDIEPGYGIHYDTEGEYQTATLVDANYQDNKGNYYVTLADAFAGALDGGSITVLRNVTDASNATLAAEKTITLNTDGKTITKTENSIKNYGTLTIEGNGTIQTPESTNNSIVRLIENWGKINLNDVTILHKGPNLPCWWYTVLSWNGEVNINNSTIEATYDKNIAKPTSGGGRTIGILNNSVLNMNSGRIIESTGMSSAVTIESYTIDSNNGKININSGTIESDCGYAIYNYDYWDGVTQPVINNFVINILGGTITSNTTSAIINGGAYSTITIGTLDGGVNTISPSIQGETYGIESTNGFKFYDGILKGKTGAFTGSVTEVEPGYGVHYDTEGEYQTATLVDANYQDNKGNYYVTLADAFAKAQDGSTITTLRDVTENTRAIANKTLTLDLNGKTIDASGVTGYWELGREFIQNQGTLTIIDTNGNGTITRNNVTSHVCVISTTGTLNLKGGTFSLSIENIEYDPSTIAVDSGTTNIYDGVNIIATRTVIDQWIAGIYAPGGILNMYGGNVEATGIEGSNTVYGIINRSDGTSTINISGGTVRSTGKGIALENHGGNIVNSQLLVSGNATIQGNLYGIYNSAITGGITIDGGTISGGRYGIYQTVDNNITTSGNINGGTGPAILIGSGTCTVNIMGGTIKTTSPDADAINLLDKSNVTLNVTNATIISGSGPYSDAIDKDGGTGDITIDGDSVLTGEQAAIINQGTGNVIIKNGILTSNSGAITSEGGGNIIIENGTITGKSNTMSAVHIKNSATLTIRGGSIISEGTSAVRSYNTAKIIIGTQGSGVSTILPMIQGATYGVDAVNGFEFYDGILKGKTGAFNGTVTKMEPGYGIHYDTEGDYKTAYLVVANYEDNATLKNTYDTLADAFAKAPDGSTITVIGENVQESTLAQLIIKSMVLDLNGKTITYSGNVEAAPYIVVQAGNLEVKDTKGNGKINNTTNYYSVLYYHYGGKIIISGGTLTGIEGIARQSEGATGTITITGGTIDTTSSCIEFDTGTSITITGGNLICSEGSCILQTSAVKTDSTITIGTQGSGVSTTSPSIQGETYAINSVSGFEFYDGILKGKSAAFKGEVTEVEPDYEVHYDTEGSYYTATLQPYTGSVHINPTIAFTNIDKVVNKQINATIIFKSTTPLLEITIQGETIDVSTIKPTVSGIEYVYEMPYTITQNGVYVATCKDATGRVAKKEQAINAFHTLMVEYEITNTSAYSDETRITFTAAYPFRILSTNPESYKDQVKNTSLTGYAMVNTMLITDDALDVTFIFEDEQGNQSNEVHVQIAGVALKFVRAVAPTESHFKAFTTMDVETAYRLAQEMENKIFVVNEKVESYYGVNKHESDLFMSRARDVGAAITLMSANKTSAFDGTVASDQGGNPKAQIDQYGLQNVGSREEYMASYLKDATQNSLTNADAKYKDVVNNLDTLRLYKGFALKTQDSSEGMFFVRTGLTSYALKTNTPFENTTFRITIVNP